MVSPSKTHASEGRTPPTRTPFTSLTGNDPAQDVRNSLTQPDDAANFRPSAPVEDTADLTDGEEDAVARLIGTVENVPTDSEPEMVGNGEDDDDGEDPLDDLTRAEDAADEDSDLPATTITPINAGPPPPPPPPPPPLPPPIITNAPTVHHLAPYLDTRPNAPLPVPRARQVEHYEVLLRTAPTRPRRGPRPPGPPPPVPPRWTDAENLILLRIWQEYHRPGTSHIHIAAIHNAIVWPHLRQQAQRSGASIDQQMGIFVRVVGQRARDYNTRVPAQIAVLEARFNNLPLPANAPLRFQAEARGAGGQMIPQPTDAPTTSPHHPSAPRSEPDADIGENDWNYESEDGDDDESDGSPPPGSRSSDSPSTDNANDGGARSPDPPTGEESGDAADDLDFGGNPREGFTGRRAGPSSTNAAPDNVPHTEGTSSTPPLARRPPSGTKRKVNEDDDAPPPKKVKTNTTANAAIPAEPTEGTSTEPLAQISPLSRSAQREKRIAENNAQRMEMEGPDGGPNIEPKW